MNPAIADCEAEMNTPNGNENPESKFIPPINVTDQKFIDLAKKMKKIKPETLSMIEKDLQPEDSEIEESPSEDGLEVKGIKVEAKEMTPAELLTGLKKVLGFTQK